MVPRLFAARWLLTTVVALAPLYFPAPVEANGQKQVLVLYSTRRDSQIAIVAERELPKILAGGLQQEPRLLLGIHRSRALPGCWL